MKLVDKSNTFTGVGVGASGVGSLVSILAFALPYWIYYDEDLTLTDGTGSHQVQLTYYYGFWNFCNKVSSDVSNTDKCGSVDSHSDVEQTTSTLLLLAILLFVSGVANGCLYLTLFKKEKLCLYITWLSVVAAGILAVTSIILFAQADHSLVVTSGVTLNFSFSKLHASFWLVAVACLLVVIATIFITMAIINVHRTEDRPDDKNSMLSYDAVHKSSPDTLKDDDDTPEVYKYSNAKVPEAFQYNDSPYSTSSESFSDSDIAFDSDDSDIDPTFAKLKVKVTPKQEELTRIEDEAPRNLTPKSAGSSIHRSRSAAALTPVEQAHSDSEAFADNPLYIGEMNKLEQGQAPLATNLIFTAPAYDSDDAFILRRAKTDMPFTQRMKATIDRKPKQNIDNEIRTPAKIETDEKSSPTLKNRTKSFPKKPQKSKRKRRQLTEEELRRARMMTDIYSASPSIPAIYPPQQTQKSAPWNSARSKMRLRPKTSTLLKWSMQAYGIDTTQSLPKRPPTSAMKNGREPVTLEDTEINEANSSNA